MHWPRQPLTLRSILLTFGSALLIGGLLAGIAYAVNFEVKVKPGESTSFSAVGETRTIEVTNVNMFLSGTPIALLAFTLTPGKEGIITISKSELETCQKKTYLPEATCTMVATYSKERGSGEAIVYFKIAAYPPCTPSEVVLKST
jgi:hypothetical protein